MDDTQMPEPLWRAVHELICEAFLYCQEVQRYTALRAGMEPA
jgi:hypothetical protein